jgi:hypothetical protein
MGPLRTAVAAHKSLLADKTVIKPVLIMVSGLPGTGKSYFSRQLAERLRLTILESDAIRKQLFQKPCYSAAESARLFRFIHQRLEERLLQGNSVILDATNLKEKYRKAVYRIAESCEARLIIVQVEAPPDVVRERLDSRGKRADSNETSDADWAVYRKMKARAEKISRPYFTVNSARDITPLIDKIVKEINL